MDCLSETHTSYLCACRSVLYNNKRISYQLGTKVSVHRPIEKILLLFVKSSWVILQCAVDRINMPSHRYRNSHYKIRRCLHRIMFIMGKYMHGKTVFILKWGLQYN